MSAIWQKKFKDSPRAYLLPAQLEPRDIPQVFLVPRSPQGDPPNHAPILSQISENPFSGWLYGAVIQTAYNGSQPAWSLNGWSFAQVNLSSISETLKHPSKNMNVSKRFGPLDIREFKAVVGTNINVTLPTAAVRGRIECTPYETLSNSSNWLQKWDLQDTSVWNVSINPEDPARGYELLPVINLSPEMGTATFARSARLLCYANGTNKEPGLSSIGFWSRNISLNEEYGSVEGMDTEESELDVAGYNFTVKWIVGKPIPQQFVDLDSKSHLIWQEPPSMAGLNCQPIIETAHASVTVDMTSGAVQNFSIIDVPSVVPSAWSDPYAEHNSTSVDESQANITVR